VVADLNRDQLDKLLSDDELIDRVRSEISSLETLLSDAPEPTIAYCSPEFGISGSMPQYAGGLGVLAGDHLKASSDLGIPMVGVGLFYREGVFHQHLEDGRQTESYQIASPSDFGAENTGVVVQVPFPGRQVDVGVWKLEVGRVPLILLDTHVDSNAPKDRDITNGLYIGSRQHRLDQEMILGVGGARALEALGMDIAVHHLNEGHAGFIVLELVDRAIENGDLAAAMDKVRPGLVFTTHTPVPAGIDRFRRSTINPYLSRWADAWGISLDELWELGRDGHSDQFNMAAFCLRSASDANGVSQLHGEVSRGLFAGVGIGDEIGSITNGVHARTWTADHFQDAFDELLGDGWDEGRAEAWQRAVAIDDEQLASLRREGSANLADLVARRTGETLDPDSLVFGFARRFAPYKRATLLFRDLDRLSGLLADDEMPIHIVMAGKAHPSDDLGKALVAEVVEFGASREANSRFTFIPDYDMNVAHAMVQGSDVWLNNPIRPREASGTSGEKAVLNGCLNCSILDGWWAEMYEPGTGWAVGASTSDDDDRRDTEDAAAMLDAITEIRTEYHENRPAFNDRIRKAWLTMGPKVSASRMLREYRDSVYTPALARSRR
jgi:starch phosphorylase